jgi:hypothetical protein
MDAWIAIDAVMTQKIASTKSALLAIRDAGSIATEKYANKLITTMSVMREMINA